MIGGTPPRDVGRPRVVDRLAGGDTVRPVWLNQLGGLTFAIGTDRYLKWMPPGSAAGDLAAEAARLAWAAPHTPVPRVLDSGSDADGAWLLTAALPGRSAVDERWQADPRTAVRAAGAGLRAMHDSLPVDTCPFSWSVETRVARARVLGADPDPGPQPPVDVLVVCHGDACLPNTLIHDDGRWSAHVDLGSLGAADRWADLAIATYSTLWNYGLGWEEELLEAYGVTRDRERIGYYRQLWDSCP